MHYLDLDFHDNNTRWNHLTIRTKLVARRYFLAGGICCSFSHGVAVPFDVVKTRLQTSSAAEFVDTNVISGALRLLLKMKN